MPDNNRSSLAAMSNTLLNSASGHTATLGTLATVTELPGQTEIRRENLQRNVVVTARLEGRDLGSGVSAVQKVVNDLHLPSSIRVVYGGTYAEQQTVVSRPAAGAGLGNPAGVCWFCSSNSVLWPRR